MPAKKQAKPKIEVKEGFIYVNGEKKAEFDQEKKSLVDFYNGGAEYAAEMLQFLKDHSEFGWKPAELSDRQIAEAENIWKIVPECVQPHHKHLGDKCPLVSKWVEENYPNVFRIRYPYGHVDIDEVGLGLNLSPYRDKTNGSVSKDGMEKLKNVRKEQIQNARRILEEQEVV
jgi:hypothetical protein